MRKQRNSRRVISLLLAFILTFSLLPVSASAAVDIARVNGQTYTSVKDAWNAVKNGGTIDLLTDWNLKSMYNDRLTVEKNAAVTVNLNGYMIDRGLANTRYYGSGDGQIFYVKDNAALTVNGGDPTPHAGYRDGHLWFPGGNGSVTLTGGVLTGGACDDSDGAGAISMMKNATVTLNDVTVAGNLADCYGALYGHAGAVRMHSSGGVLNLNGSKILYNHAEDNGGGIYVNEENNLIRMNNSEVSYNFACDDGGGIYSNDIKTTVTMSNGSKIEHNSADAGAGIYFDYTQFVLKSEDASASISYNQATSGDGGALHIQHDRSWAFFGNTNYGTVYGITFDGNTASGDGGAIYIQQEGIAVSGCKITGNTADEGGGIYNNNDDNSISGTTITNNRASSDGGGVFSSCMNDLALSGKVVIENNKRGDGTADDLYLNDTWATTAYLVGSPTGQSKIGIRTETPQERKLGKNQQFYFENAFFYNGSGYHIEFDEDKAELWLKQGTKVPIVAEKVSPEATVTGERYNDKAIIRGYFSYPSVVETSDDLSAVFYYSDGYFLNGTDAENGDPALYNEHLATMSMTMAMAGFYSNIGNDGTLGSGRAYTYKSQNIEKILTDIGVEPDNIYISDSNTVKPGTSTIGVAIGQKKLNGSDAILVPIAVRGAGYESEWYGNTSVGKSGEHEGFAIAADQVFQQVQNYIRDYGLTDAVNSGKVKFWIAGYSRAGATSNLTAKRLIEAYCDETSTAKSNQVYAYCFEAPKGGMNSAMKLAPEKYYSIHNCINKADAVPMVAPEEMGFVRYGVDHYIPGSAEAGTPVSGNTVWSYVASKIPSNYQTWSDNTSWTVGSNGYQSQRAKMLAQLRSVDPTNIYFYDRFKLAEVNYIDSALGSDLIAEIGHWGDQAEMTQEEFARVLMRSLQAWGFYRSYDRDFRYGYTGQFSNAETGAVSPSFEQALQTVTKIFFSKSSSDLNGMLEAASGTMDRLSTGQLFNIWNDMIGDWTTLSQSERESYLQMLWEAVMEGAPAGGKPAADYLTASERSELRSVWNVLLDVLLRFVEVDYNTSVINWNNSKTPVSSSTTGKRVSTPVMDGLSDSNEGYYYRDSNGFKVSYTQVVLGTLANNATALMEAHYPEINFAWLRSYDSLYNGDANKPVEIRTSDVPTVTSELRKQGVNSWESVSYDSNTLYLTGDHVLRLSTDTKGAGIYYRVNGGDWKPYNKPIELSVRGSDTSYHVEVTAAYCGKTSESVAKDYVISKITTYQVWVDYTPIGSFQEGDLVIIGADAGDNRVFKNWNQPTIVNEYGQGNGELANTTLNDENSTITTFTMPACNVCVIANYINRISNVTLCVDEPAVGKPLPEKGTLSWGEDQSKEVSVYWLEQVGGSTQLASGKAKYGTSYSVAALVEQDVSGGLVFAKNVSGWIQYGDDEPVPARGETKVDAAGALRIFGDQVETAKAKVTDVPELTVSIVKDSSKEDLIAILPDSVAVTTEDGTKTAGLTYPDREVDSVQLNNADDYTVSANVDYTELNMDSNGHETAAVHVKVYSNGAVAAPTASVTGGNAEKEVTLSCATEGAEILYKINDENYQEYNGPITLNCDEGETKTYTITARARMIGSDPSSEVTFTYVLSNPLPTYTVTIHGKDTGTKQDGLWKKTYTYTKGDMVTIAAPAEADELFEKWESIPDGVDGKEADASLKIDRITGNVELTAIYNPVVKKLDLTLDAPTLGTPLAESITSAAATVTKENDVTELFDTIEWTPELAGGATPAYNTAYTAKLTLSANPQLKFFLSEHMELTVNGGDNGIRANIGQEDGEYVIYVTFPATDKLRLAAVEQPENVYATREQAAAGQWGLPKRTTLLLSDGSREKAEITWSVSGYDANDLEAQTLNAAGTVTVPENVEQGSVSRRVTAKVFVAAAEQVKAPAANLASGTYTGAQAVRLSCETEGAEIYYTLDGSDPTTASTPYDGGVIELANADAVTELHAIAVKDGMRSSIMAIYRYEVKKETTKPTHGGGSSGGSGKPADKPAETKDYKSCGRSTDCPLQKFSDLTVNGWYHDGIHYCLTEGLMNGYDNNRFGPNDPVSRAQIVTILWRLAGSPESKTAPRFTDTAEGMYYTKAVSWAAENGVVNGYADGRFGTNVPVTREQFAAMLYRYAKLQGYDVSVGESTNILSYDDALSVSQWAMSAMQWACGAGLINGVSGSRLLPQGNATRAQMAMILMRFHENTVK